MSCCEICNQNDDRDHMEKELRDQLDQARETNMNLWNDLRAAEQRIDDYEAYIMRLKAKIFDLMYPEDASPAAPRVQSLEELLGNG